LALNPNQYAGIAALVGTLDLLKSYDAGSTKVAEGRLLL
jgi:hypothetical protein